MKSKGLNQHQQQSRSDTNLSNGWLQRAGVREVPGKEVESLQESGLNRSFVSVPVRGGGLPVVQRKLTIREKDKHESNEILNQQVTEENKTGLPNRLKAGIENLSGYSMDDVRVHYNSPKPANLQALAYTQGTDIHVAPGQEEHLPHEAWHVVQQKQGRVKPTMQMKGVGVNDNEGLEREADVMGAKAILQRKCENCGTDAISPNIFSGEKEEKLQFLKQLNVINRNTIQRQCGNKDASKFTNFGFPKYGGLSNDSGSCMDVLLNANSSGGSAVSSFPNWWPTGTDRTVLNKYMVQGHLWNEKLGGPGNARNNLTPITKSANSQHNAKVEGPLKTDLQNPKTALVHYVVTVDYSAVPKESEIAPNYVADQPVIKKYVGNMAKKIHAEYTMYDANLQDIGSKSWDIGNEHSSIT